jgi:hypothetical protein
LTDASGERHGCFVTANGFMTRLTNRLDASASRVESAQLRGLLVGLAEAFVIDRAFVDGVPQDGPRGGGRALRLHVAGDAASPLVARALADAAERWRARGGGPVWSYTHRWRAIPVDAWGPISIFASVETGTELAEANRRGYAAALTIDQFPKPRSFTIPDAPGVRVRACPVEVGRTHADGTAITCVSCGWCFNDAGLRRVGVAIGFAIHGHEGGAAVRSITEIQRAETLVQLRLNRGARGSATQRHLPIVR